MGVAAAARRPGTRLIGTPFSLPSTHRWRALSTDSHNPSSLGAHMLTHDQVKIDLLISSHLINLCTDSADSVLDAGSPRSRVLARVLRLHPGLLSLAHLAVLVHDRAKLCPWSSLFGATRIVSLWSGLKMWPRWLPLSLDYRRQFLPWSSRSGAVWLVAL